MLKPLGIFFRGPLIMRILVGVALALVLFVVSPTAASHVGFLGTLFVTLLKSIAPFLVFILLVSSIIRADAGSNRTIRTIVFIYIFSSVAASFLAAAITFAAPHIHLELLSVDDGSVTLATQKNTSDVLFTQLFRMFENPISALVSANFMAVLTWAVAFGIAFRHTKGVVREFAEETAAATSRIVGWIVQLAPFGVFGIFADVLANQGTDELLKYGQLIVLLLVAFASIVFIFFPVMGFLILRRNPFPLLLKCFAISGTTAFFSRSSAANIPVNLAACKRFGLSEKVYSFTIPLGANINLTAASVTISVLAITAAFSLGIDITVGSAVIACVVAALCGLGASGVPGGSLIMIPIAASAFGISPEIASKMIAIGFLISIIQDSVETAINSAGDLYYTALVCEKYDAMGDKDGE